jgi:hypothetical protein
MPKKKAKEAKPAKLPKLPQLLDRKLYKTGQTRGADDDVIYQNRVSRSSTVLIPYSMWSTCKSPAGDKSTYENGFIVLISPDYYFLNKNITKELAAEGLTLGENALVFYVSRAQWIAYDPTKKGWKPASHRSTPLGGQYVARVAATTALDGKGEKINKGFTETKKKGAGIRVYEYADSQTINLCRLQLEAVFWLCSDAENVAVANGMTAADASTRKEWCLAQCKEKGLLDVAKLADARIINADGKSVCPLCLEELSAQGFFNRMEQAEGREVHDLTVTQLNLFHIKELRFGVSNHRPYNLGMGHHHCNVVVKDSGIIETLHWMKKVVDRNTVDGHLPAESASNIAS